MLRRLAFVLAFLVLSLSRTAHADEIAPELEGADLRVKARGELRRLVAALPERERARLVGVYVAIDPSPSEPIAQVACDDDGDPVVLVSDAMLRLVAQIARADIGDEHEGTRKVEAYATFLARSQAPGRRLLPPPPGSYASAGEDDARAERLGEALAFVLGSELARLGAAELVCPRPTATRESGDDTWTPAERRMAADVAARTYPGTTLLDRDRDAFGGVRPTRGALAVLRFFATLEGATGRFAPRYATDHARASARLEHASRLCP